MGKELIKELLRENLYNMSEASEEPQNDAPESEPEEDDKEEKGGMTWGELSDRIKKKVKTLTLKIRNATQGKNKILKLSQLAQATGVIDDAGDAAERSEIGKKVSGKPDADGKVRHLTPDEANKLGKGVDNPNAFKKTK